MEGSSTAAIGRPIKVGVIADQTGPLSFMGIADADVAKMVVDDIDAGGGLLGQQIELHLDHRVRMNMYIGQVRNGAVKIVDSLGVIDPDERQVAA
jgi:ABC-type branched-subunit amino acid transport system substrate-binding protein